MSIASIRLPFPGRNAAPPRAGWFQVVRELVLMGGLFFLYSQIRYLTRDDTAQAMSNARAVVRFERSLGGFVEPTVQDAVVQSELLVGFLNRYYVGVHFPLTALFVVWVVVRHADWYRQIRTWLIAVTAAGLAIHVAYPLAPPRMLAHEGFVDTLRVFGPNIYPADTTQSVANQFAAMPSLHFGWAVIVAGGFIAIRRTRWSLLALAHPFVTLVAIVATANHYLLDALVAGVLCLAAAPLCGMFRRPEPTLESVQVSAPRTATAPCRPSTAHPGRPAIALASTPVDPRRHDLNRHTPALPASRTSLHPTR